MREARSGSAGGGVSRSAISLPRVNRPCEPTTARLGAVSVTPSGGMTGVGGRVVIPESGSRDVVECAKLSVQSSSLSNE